MISHQGIFLPEGEQHLQEWMDRNGEMVDGRGTYQLKKLRVSMEYVKRFRNAADIGAHVGMWTMQLLKRFEFVHAFEPVAAFRECWKANISGMPGAMNWALYPVALGASAGWVSLRTNPASSGDTCVDRASAAEMPGTVEMRTLDSFGFDYLDFAKIDVEGFERQVIDGARKTIERCRPTIIVEQKQHVLRRNYGLAGTPAVDLLKELGYSVAREIGGDYVMVPK